MLTDKVQAVFLVGESFIPHTANHRCSETSREIPKVDSFKRSGKIKSYLQLEVNFLTFYAQKERKLSEFSLAKAVRGVGFEPTNPYGTGS